MIRMTQSFQAVFAWLMSKPLVILACVALSAAFVQLQGLHRKETMQAQASAMVMKSSSQLPAPEPLTETPADRLSLDTFQGSGSGAYSLDPFARDFALDSVKSDDETTSTIAAVSRLQDNESKPSDLSRSAMPGFYAFHRDSSPHEIATIVNPETAASND